MFRSPFRSSSALLRRAQVAGVVGFLVFGVAVVGEIAARSLRLLWVFVAFAGLGSVLRAWSLLAAARREFRQRADEAGE